MSPHDGDPRWQAIAHECALLLAHRQGRVPYTRIADYVECRDGSDSGGDN